MVSYQTYLLFQPLEQVSGWMEQMEDKAGINYAGRFWRAQKWNGWSGREPHKIWWSGDVCVQFRQEASSKHRHDGDTRSIGE